MSTRSFSAFCLLFLASFCHPFAQSNSLKADTFPHKEIILAKTSFIDIGPPFDFYSLYKLTSTADGTDVEKIAITPTANVCNLRATTEVAHAHIEQRLGDLFDQKDPCSIPERALHREAKRCKHCLTFSGIHVAAQVQCNGKQRSISYEVLDRDLFASRPNTPLNTSRSMTLMSTLDKAFGGGDLDRPIFQTATPAQNLTPNTQTPTLQDVANGRYDGLFSESISRLYRDSQLPPQNPIVALEVSSPSTPTFTVMPGYPPIARAAHVQGKVMLQLQVDGEGKVTDFKFLSGPAIFQGVTLEALKKWTYSPEVSGQTQTITLKFEMNCLPIWVSQSSTSR